MKYLAGVASVVVALCVYRWLVEPRPPVVIIEDRDPDVWWNYGRN